MTLFIRNCLLCSLLLLAGGVKAQVYFNKSYALLQPQNSTSVLELPGNGYMVIGQETATSYRALCIVRTDINGDTIWLKKYPRSGYAYYTGQSGSLIESSDGNFVFAGSIINLSDTVNTSDVLLMKFDANGDTLWSKVFGGPYFDAGRICDETTDGGFVIIGESSTGPNGTDFYLIKTDSQGNLQWESTYPVSGNEMALSGQQTIEGGYILSGMRTVGGGDYDHFVLKIAANGVSVDWSRMYGSGQNDGGCYIIQTTDSGYVLSGGLDQGSGNMDASIRKINKDGNQQWLSPFPTSTINVFDTRAVELSDGSIVAAGSGYNTQGTLCGYLAKVDKDGNEVWQRLYQKNASYNYGYDVKHTTDNGFIICGMTSQPSFSTDVWLVKVDSMGCLYPNCALGMEEAFIDDKFIAAFPNPNNGVFTIRFPAGEEDQAQVRVMNSVGQEIRAVAAFNNSGITIDISHQPKGIYLLKITTFQRSYFTRVVKQ